MSFKIIQCNKIKKICSSLKENSKDRIHKNMFCTYNVHIPIYNDVFETESMVCQIVY